MKKIVSLICSLAIIMGLLTGIVYADRDVSVYVNNNYIYFDQKPIIQNGRTLVPMRAIFEALDCEVEWDGDSQTVSVYQDDYWVLDITVGEDYMDIGEYVALDVPAQIINDRTLVPLRAISESIGARVEWDGDDYEVNITYSEDYSSHDGTTMDDYYYLSYDEEVPNFGWFCNLEPWYSDNGYYEYGYITEYDDDEITDEVDYYIESLEEDEGWTLTATSNGEHEKWTYLSGNGYKLAIHIDLNSHIVSVKIEKTASTPRPTTKPTVKPTPRPTPETMETPIVTESEYVYLKNMSIWDQDADSKYSSYMIVDKNGVQFNLNHGSAGNPTLEIDDECTAYVEYDLSGEYSKLTGVISSSSNTAIAGNAKRAAFRFYCDDKLVYTTPVITSETDINIDLENCNILRIEVFSKVEKRSYTSKVKITDAKLWY